ncbi:hypothetical protein BDA96_01G330600 [Sorghum bicolor]|uniref:Uncharacterized protein n=1 Tax=Sorghum bicolor TaxID=4558 RepID=A0A921S2U2_SORBI|nr:hypothetical protein BDA96_01G330600 [Sorghum bicolor]
MKHDYYFRGGASLHVQRWKKRCFPILTISSSFTNLLRRGRSRRRKKNPYSQQRCLFVLQLFFHVNMLNCCNQKTECKSTGTQRGSEKS